jgi:hypothetical protein
MVFVLTQIRNEIIKKERKVREKYLIIEIERTIRKKEKINIKTG